MYREKKNVYFCNISILRRFKGKLYSCEEFNIANRLAHKIKCRLNFILQLFVSALKTRYTVLRSFEVQSFRGITAFYTFHEQIFMDVNSIVFFSVAVQNFSHS